jgi:hypothetical protein
MQIKRKKKIRSVLVRVSTFRTNRILRMNIVGLQYIYIFCIPVKTQQLITITHFALCRVYRVFMGLKYNVATCLGSHEATTRRYDLQIVDY